MRTGCRVLAVTGAVDPVAFTGIVLDAEIVAHRDQLCVARPPFAEDALGAIGPFYPPPHTAPGEGNRRISSGRGSRRDGLGQ